MDAEVSIIYPIWYYYIRRRSLMLTESSLSISVTVEGLLFFVIGSGWLFLLDYVSYCYWYTFSCILDRA